jgi:hypothetical protein
LLPILAIAIASVAGLIACYVLYRHNSLEGKVNTIHADLNRKIEPLATSIKRLTDAHD